MGALPNLENHLQGQWAEGRWRLVRQAYHPRPAEAEHFPDLGLLLRAEKNLAPQLGRA
jgi:hypothetical protein